MDDRPQTNLQLLNQLRRAGYPDDDVARIKVAYDFVSGHFAGWFRGSGKPFLAHLVGTTGILGALRARTPVVTAGLSHAVYQLGKLPAGSPGMSRAMRAQVRWVLGTEAEALVARYATLEWNVRALPALRARLPALSPADRDVVMGLLSEKQDPSGKDRVREQDQGKAIAGKSTLNRLELTPEDANEKSRTKIVAEGEKIDELMVAVFIESYRSAPSEVVLDVDATDDPDKAVQQIHAAIGTLEPFAVEVERKDFMYPSEVAKDAESVLALTQAIQVMLGREANYSYSTAANDTGFLNAKGIQAINYGSRDIRF